MFLLAIPIHHCWSRYRRSPGVISPRHSLFSAANWFKRIDQFFSRQKLFMGESAALFIPSSISVIGPPSALRLDNSINFYHWLYSIYYFVDVGKRRKNHEIQYQLTGKFVSIYDHNFLIIWWVRTPWFT